MLVVRSGYVQVGKDGLVRKRVFVRQAEERGSRLDTRIPSFWKEE